MNIIVINREVDKERFQRICGQLYNIKQSFTHIHAVNGDLLTPPNRLTGCILSHISVWERIYKEKFNFSAPTLILEDDVTLSNHFLHAVNTGMAILPDNIDIAFLGYGMYKDTSWNTVYPGWRIPQAGDQLDFHGAYGYVVRSTAAAEILLVYAHANMKSPDILMKELINQGKLKAAFACMPPVQHGAMESVIKHHLLP